ncbi:uncharacterized protein LOC118202696 isoform X2 [Stegodyphus dumicola]|uniref:uncharacterized protein LOC118202696 isoform X2 n=1 Tax=Stegodyphus dumicola TaxID=202533 RepID=UPI0015B2152A|nr:uncharacterized protein LOC118202696 isoform X2 [Stegodyphus dumicola]
MRVMMLVMLAVAVSTDVVYRPDDEHCNRTVDIYQAVSSPPVNDENRNRPLHCSYRIRVRPARNDWVVFVRFTRMRVGEPTEDRRRCIGGYVQIIDGYRDSNHSNKEDPGYYCGEIDSPKTFVSETPHVKIVLHVDSYGHDTFLQFDANVEQQQEVHARYGQYAQLYPHRRGTPVPGSYCERTFHGCAPTRCFVQSPGFPGIYPRNLRCRYTLVVSRSVVALDMNAFDVDGLRCDNLLLCFPRPVTRDPADCPFDYVKIYDGATEDSPLIVTLCGRGRLKSQIVASGSEMLVEFVTSTAGPLLNTGFHFKAESVHAETETEYEFLHLDSNGTCAIDRHLRSGDIATFGHLRSWYPVNTTCTYRFTSSEDEILKLTFEFFRMERVTLCEESLKLYDSSSADPSKIISKLCDINKPRTEHPRSIYETSGPGLFVEFNSRIGSLEGSSLSYAFEVRPVNVITRRNSLNGGTCSRTFTPEGGMAGLLSGHPLGEANVTTLTCNYTFDASRLPQGRVQLALFTSLKLAQECSDCRQEPLYAQVHLGFGDKICFCKVSTHRSHTLTSLGPMMHFSLHADASWDKKLPQKHVVNGSYIFYTESRCGPERLELDLQGLLTFPPLISGPGTCPEGQCPDTPISCQWKIPVFHRMDLLLKIDGLPEQANCSTDHAIVNNIVLCPSSEEQELLFHKEDIFESDVTVSLRLSEKSYNFTVRWTQLRMLPSRTSSDTLVSLGKDCDFLCTSSMACLTRELVCNGVANCPGPATTADEDVSLCVLPRDNFKLYWWIIGFGLGICVCLTLCLAFTICRKCQVRRHRI